MGCQNEQVCQGRTSVKRFERSNTLDIVLYKNIHFVYHLQKHYTEVMAKFRKFQRPVDFEPKLTHVKRVLDEIEERIHLIELRSEDPDIIQGQLDQCMVGSISFCIQMFSCIFLCVRKMYPFLTESA